MNQKKPRIGTKGAGRYIANELSKIRKAPLPKEIFSIIEEHNNLKKQTPKKSAKPSSDLDI